jgi:hypothetical protein
MPNSEYEVSSRGCYHNQSVAEDWLPLEEIERLIRESAIEGAFQDGDDESASLHVNIPARLKGAVQALADTSGRTLTSIVEAALYDYLEARRPGK